MNVLFIGDSITRGRLGESYVRLLEKDFLHCRFTNLGRNGDPLIPISEQLKKELEQGRTYDWVFIQGGYNDIMLPRFRKKGKLFFWAYKQQIKKGLFPILSEEEFELALKHIIAQTKKLHAGKIVLFTIGTINEYQNWTGNKKRLSFNDIIRRVAEEEDIFLADVAATMDKKLAVLHQANYFLQNFWAVTFTDYLYGACFGWQKLSRKRSLHLTIDGVHLNKNGAMIYKEAVSEILQLASEKESQYAVEQTKVVT